MTTLTQAEKMLSKVTRTEANKKPYDAALLLIENVKKDLKNESTLKTIESLINDCKYLDESQKIYEELEKPKKSRAADMAKSRAKASFLRDVRLTDKAEKNLIALCEKLNLNKTQVVNKLLEEQEQLKLL